MVNEVLEKLTTIRDFIRWGTSEFTRKKLTFGHGYACAFDEAVYLTLYALSLPDDWPESYYDCVLTRAERKRVLTYLYKRATARIPSAYLTKQAWFAGLKFYVDKRVLIPRSPIAELIEEQFEPWVDSDQVHSILDLCTGSGCIAIACQYVFPEAKIVASDISTDALQVARYNCEQHNLVDEIKLIESDVFESIPLQKFDIIVSNPPYVDAEDMSSLPGEFSLEPKLGLEAGDDGLDIVTRILLQAVDYLTDDGVLIVEVGNSQPAVMEKFSFIPMTWLEFARGGTGVFKVKMKYLKICQEKINNLVLEQKQDEVAAKVENKEPVSQKISSSEIKKPKDEAIKFHALSGQDVIDNLKKMKVDDYQLIPFADSNGDNQKEDFEATQVVDASKSPDDAIDIDTAELSEKNREKIVNDLLAEDEEDDTKITFPNEADFEGETNQDQILNSSAKDTDSTNQHH